LELFSAFSIRPAKKTARGSLTAKDFWETLKDHLQGHESYTKIYLSTPLYTVKLEEGAFDVAGCFKSTESVWRRLKEVDLKLPKEIFELITPMCLLSSFGIQKVSRRHETTFPWRL
jgi:hypothetical protein